MNNNSRKELAESLFQVMRQFARVRFSRHPSLGMKPSEFELLGFLHMNGISNDNALTVTELSKILKITPAGVTHLINPLEEQGHVHRLQDANDRRIVRINLTEQGSKVAERIIEMIQKRLGGLIEFLGEEDSKNFIRLMTSVTEFISSQPESDDFT